MRRFDGNFAVARFAPQARLTHNTRPMLLRYIVVILGASAIVVALLLAMNEAANRFSLRDATRYFRVSDFIPAPDAGRRLPDAPPRPAVAPDRPELQYEVPADAPLAIEPPRAAPGLPSRSDEERSRSAGQTERQLDDER